jgi:hypothetical protein
MSRDRESISQNEMELQQGVYKLEYDGARQLRRE